MNEHPRGRHLVAADRRFATGGGLLAPLLSGSFARILGRIDRGLEVLGTTYELGRVLDDVEPQEVLIAIPSAPGTVRAKVVAACRERGVPVRTMPTVFELLQTGGRLMRQVREVKVEDVLGREPVRM